MPTNKIPDIALFLPSLAAGGAENVFITLASFFTERGLTVDLVVARCEGPLLKKVPKTVRLVDLKVSRPSWGIPALINYLRRYCPRSILSALTHANIAVAIAHRLTGGKRRCVLSERADLIVHLIQEKRPFDRWLIRKLGYYTYRWADAIISVSEGVANSVEGVFGIEKSLMQVIYNPIDINSIRKLSRQEVYFPWDDTYPVFIAVGRLTKQKDYYTLLKAFRILCSQISCHLAILGEGEDRSPLESLIYKLKMDKDVWLPGYIENPYAYMARATVFVSSSLWEGLSNVLIEALALNLPIVATDCPSGSAEILGNGRYGILVPPSDPYLLSKAMLDALQGKAPQFDYEEAISRFDPDIIVNQYLNVLGV